MIGLTPRARALLVYLTERETCPTYREMAAALELKAVSQIASLVRQLESRGYIRIRGHRWRLGVRRHRQRAIEVLIPAYPPVIIKGERYRFIPVSRGVPEAACSAPAPLSGVSAPSVIPAFSPCSARMADGFNRGVK